MFTRAITYDLNTKAMKEAGLTRSEVTSVYNEGKRVFVKNGMSDHQQFSMYATEDKPDALKTVIKVVNDLKIEAPTFCRYLSRFAVVHIDDSVDLTDILWNTGHEAA